MSYTDSLKSSYTSSPFAPLPPEPLTPICSSILGNWYYLLFSRPLACSPDLLPITNARKLMSLSTIHEAGSCPVNKAMPPLQISGFRTDKRWENTEG